MATTEELSQRMKTLGAQVSAMSKLLREIGRLEKARGGNATALAGKVARLRRQAAALASAGDLVAALDAWGVAFEEDLAADAQQLHSQFGVQLERQLAQRQLKLSGHYPELQVAFVTVEPDLDKRRVLLWYGPKQERLGRAPLDAVAAAAAIDKVLAGLGSRLEPPAFVERLRRAYQRAAPAPGQPARIIEVLAELAPLLQSDAYRENPLRERYRDYSRADFSYDLLRLRQSDKRNEVMLTVATKSATRKRGDFLWVPDDPERVAGTTYATLLVRGG